MKPSTCFKKKNRFSCFLYAVLFFMVLVNSVLMPPRLNAFETSPSRIKWTEWNSTAFERARNEDKPLFLSITYPSCYWCYVMDEESFKNPEVADFLNEHFIPVRIDRDERPDLDQAYQDALKLMTGAGGWPVTLFLTHELKPFFGGTFFPSVDRWGKTGLLTALNEIRSKWILERESIEAFSEKVFQNMNQMESLRQVPGAIPAAELLRRAAENLRAEYDPAFGGFGAAPKFPRANEPVFLMRAYKRFRDREYLSMAENTLLKIRHSAVYDHLGGGVFRSAAQADWFLPQFEKMLYDQALLSGAYLELYQLTRNPAYASIAEDIFRYVLRDLLSPSGAFFAGQSSASVEEPSQPGLAVDGAYYVWDEQEIRDAFDAKAAPIVLEHYGVRYEGNVEKGGPYGNYRRKNMLSIQEDIQKLALQYKVSPEFVSKTLYEAKQKLFEMRRKRMPPAVDRRVLTDWNGLMISSLAKAGAMLGRQDYLDAASRVADFLLAKRLDSNGRLYHSTGGKNENVVLLLSDYAFFVQGLLDLYEAGFETRYLQEAVRLNQKMSELFADSGGGFRMTAGDAAAVFQIREIEDSHVPSGNAAAVSNLLRLSRILADESMRRSAEKHIQAFGGTLETAPRASLSMLLNIDWLTGPAYEVVLAGSDDAALKAMREALYEVYLPQKIVLHAGSGKDQQALEKLAPYIKDHAVFRSRTTAYVCRDYVCEAPTDRPQKLRQLLQSRAGENTAFRLFG